MIMINYFKQLLIFILFKLEQNNLNNQDKMKLVKTLIKNNEEKAETKN